MPAILDAVRAYATVGEMVDALAVGVRPLEGARGHLTTAEEHHRATGTGREPESYW